MIFKEKKTPTLLMMPLANGWRAVHKKYKNEYGTVICTEKGDTVEVVTGFGEFSTERTEAVESAAAMIFENSGVKEITVDGEKLTREAWQEKEDARLNALHRTRKDYKNVLGKPVHCVTDRPLGSAHPRYPEMIYPVNYGYVPGVMAGDNAEQDVYILGPTEPLKTFDGVVIAVVHRFNDVEDKWVAAEKTGVYTAEEQRILDGGSVDKAAYTARAVFTVDSEKLLERGRLISVRAHTRFAPFPRHAHSYIEIMYMCSGKTVHRINGGEPITVHAGELLFLGRGASHEIERAEYEDIAVNFIVLPQFFDTALERIGADNALGRFIANSISRAGGSDFLLFRVADVLPVQNLVENLVWTLVNDTKNRRRITQNTMALLFLELLNCTDKLAASENEGDHSALVMTALREIEENYRTASLTDIAEKYGVTISYLSAAVHSTTGFTFKSLLRRKRMEKAAALLSGTKLSVSDIIMAVGYENTSYFYRAFSEMYGVTPREYRLRQRG